MLDDQPPFWKSNRSLSLQVAGCQWRPDRHERRSSFILCLLEFSLAVAHRNVSVSLVYPRIPFLSTDNGMRSYYSPAIIESRIFFLLSFRVVVESKSFQIVCSIDFRSSSLGISLRWYLNFSRVFDFNEYRVLFLFSVKFYTNSFYQDILIKIV